MAYQIHKNDVPPSEAGLGTGGGGGGAVSTQDPLADENLVLLERCLPLFRELELNVLFICEFRISSPGLVWSGELGGFCWVCLFPRGTVEVTYVDT